MDVPKLTCVRAGCVFQMIVVSTANPKLDSIEHREDAHHFTLKAPSSPYHLKTILSSRRLSYPPFKEALF